MYELAAFAADKLSKSVFFDASIPYGEKVRRIETYGERMMEVYDATGEDFFLVFSSAILGRLANDLKYRGGTQEDIARVQTKTANIRNIISQKEKFNEPLKSVVVLP